MTAPSSSRHPGTRQPSERPTSPGLDVPTLAAALRHRWKLALPCALVAGVLAVTAVKLSWSRLATSSYRSYALLRCLIDEQPAVAARGRPVSYDVRGETELVKARFVLRAALRQHAVANLDGVRRDPDAALARLEEYLKVEMLSSEIMRISLTGPDPEELPVLVNSVRDAYVAEVVDVDGIRRLARFNLLQGLFAECERQLHDKQRELLTGHGGDAALARETEQVAMERFRAFQGQLQRVELDLVLSRSGPAAADETPDVPPHRVDEIVEADPSVRQLRERVARLADTLAECQRVAVGTESCSATRRELQSVRATLNERRQALRPLAEKQLADEGARRGRDRAAQERQANARLEREQKLLSVKADRQWQELRKHGAAAIEERVKRFEVEQLESTLRRVAEEKETARLGLHFPRRAVPLQDAERGEPVGRRAEAAAAWTSGLGAFALVGLSFSWLEVRSGAVRTAKAASRALGVPILGSLPAVPPDVCRSPAQPAQHGDGVWRAAMTESTDAIRTVLLHELREVPSPVLMVTSAMPGEAKSTFASHLAVSLARAGKHTLLVDGDLMRPAVHQLFGLPLGPGLSDVLRSSGGVSDAIQGGVVDGLSVLTAGQADVRAVQELGKDPAGLTMRALKSSFDVIVLDSSPVLSLSHALLLARHADAVVLSLLNAVSRAPLLEVACQRLEALDIPILGAVLNGIAPTAGEYGYCNYRREEHTYTGRVQEALHRP